MDPLAKAETTTAPRRRISRKKRLVGVAFLGLIVVSLIGLWFLLYESTTEDVRQLMGQGDYAKAVEAIDDAGPLVLPQSSELKQAIEREWWRKLDPHGVQHKEDALKKLQDELGLFEKAFPRHAEIDARRKAIVLALTPLALVMNEIDRLLTDNDFVGARRASTAKRTDLLPADQKIIEDKIAHKLAVHDRLERVKKQMAANRFEEALAEFGESKLRFDFPADKKNWDELFAEAKQGEHKRLVGAADLALNIAMEKGMVSALDETKRALAAFRAKYPGEWLPGLEKYQLAANVHHMIERAWTAMLAAEFPMCLGEIAEIEGKFPFDPAGNRHGRVLTALIKAHQAAEGKDRVTAANELVKEFDADASQLNDVAPKLWKALAALEHKNRLFSFDNANRLATAVPASGPAAIARSTLVADVLDRLVKQKGSWRPAGKQWEQCGKLCEMITAHDIDVQDKYAWVRALDVECRVEGSAGEPGPGALLRLDKKSWYGAYVAALVLHKRKSQEDAANLILEIDPREIGPSIRLAKSIDMMRQAANSLFRESKNKRNFDDPSDANKAKTWLIRVVGLEADHRLLLADLMDLALAAGVATDADTLKIAADRLVKLLTESTIRAEEKEQAYFRLAQSYRTCDKAGRYARNVIMYCDKALKVNEVGQSQWRRWAAQEGVEYALTLAKERLKGGKEFDSVLRMSEIARSFAEKLRGLAFEVAAERNRDAFALRLDATSAKFPADDQKIGEAFLAGWPDKFDEFHLPVVIHKLTQLPKLGYLDPKNDFVKKAIKNPYLDKTMTEARLAISFQKAPAGVNADGVWWKKTRADLMLAMFECLTKYADKGTAVILNDNTKWNADHIPKLREVLGHYLEARKLIPDLDRIAQGHSFRQVGLTYVRLGHAYKADDNLKALENYRNARAELKQIPPLYRNRLPADEREELRVVETKLKEILQQ